MRNSARRLRYFRAYFANTNQPPTAGLSCAAGGWFRYFKSGLYFKYFIHACGQDRKAPLCRGLNCLLYTSSRPLCWACSCTPNSCIPAHTMPALSPAALPAAAVQTHRRFWTFRCSTPVSYTHLLAGPDALLESVKVMLAATASRAQGGAPVALDALTDAMPAYDGRAFCRSYGAAAGRLY